MMFLIMNKNTKLNKLWSNTFLDNKLKANDIITNKKWTNDIYFNEEIKLISKMKTMIVTLSLITIDNTFIY